MTVAIHRGSPMEAVDFLQGKGMEGPHELIIKGSSGLEVQTIYMYVSSRIYMGLSKLMPQVRRELPGDTGYRDFNDFS
jgi:hypothetical protein